MSFSGHTTPLEELVGPSMELENISIYEGNYSLEIWMIAVSIAKAIKSRKVLCNLAIGGNELFEGVVIISY